MTPAVAAAPGTLDQSFGNHGIASAGSDIRFLGTAVEGNGDVVAAGQRGIASGSSTLVVARFTPSGSLDGSFGGGVVNGPTITSQFGSGSVGRAVAVQPDGKIVVVGSATDGSGTHAYGLIVERFNSNGALDTSFGSGGVARVLSGTQTAGDGYAVAIESNGDIVAGGSANAAGSGNGVYPRAAVALLSRSGAPVSSFGSGGSAVIDLGPYSYAQAVAVQSNGDIVIGGKASPGLQVVNALIARLTPAGHLDPTFASGGVFSAQYAISAASSAFNALAIQGNGDIVAGGAATHGNTGADALFVRFTPSGAQDGSFGSGGVVRETSAIGTVVTDNVPGVHGVALVAGGDIVGGGTASNTGVSSIAVWALTPSGALEPRFGSGGVAVTGFGSPANGEGNALAIGRSGLIAVAGDANTLGTSFSGIVVAYNGLGAPVTGPRLSVSVTGVNKSYKIGEVLSNGVRLTVRCNVACRIIGALTASASVAKQLKIKARVCTTKKGHRHCREGYFPLRFSQHSASLGGAGSKTFRLRPGGAFAKALKLQTKVTVRLVVSVTSSAGNRTITKSLTLKR